MLTAIAFILAFASGCLLALFRHPIYGFVTYVGLVYIHPPAHWWGQVLPSLRWSLIAATVTLLAVIIHRSKATEPRLFEFSVMSGLLLFIGWLGVQSFWALDQTMHIDLLILTAKYALLAALM